jgi:hypothetical protein
VLSVGRVGARVQSGSATPDTSAEYSHVSYKVSF